MVPRTVSIYFANDTFVDIAKVEGGQAYKVSMNGYIETADTLSLNVPPRYCPLPQHLCHLWPLRDVQAHNPLHPMLRALLAAARTTPEDDMNSVLVSSMMHENWIERLADVRSALKEIQIDGWHQGLHRAVPCFVLALQLDEDCDDAYEPSDVNEQIFMATEYSTLR